jgi:hypothetical protein
MRIFLFAQARKAVLRFKVKAGVLQLALGIGVIISVICSSMILLVFYGNLFLLEQTIETTVLENSLSGIQFGIAARSSLTFNEKIKTDLFADGTDSIEVCRKPWGIFELVTSKAWRGKHEATRSALITAQPDTLGRSVIYTPDNNTPIYLAGSASIVGTAYLSERKLSPGFVNGKSYSGETLIQGDVLKSQSSLLTLDTGLINQVKNLLMGNSGSYRRNSLSLLPVRQDLSFNDELVNYYATNQSIDLSDSLRGNLIIHSAIKVRVTAEAVLSDIILIAPDIDIDNGFKGSLQCFATRSITVGKDCRLNYPSALVLLGGGADSVIVIKSDAVVVGQAIVEGYGQNLGGKGKLKIEKGGLLHGMAYVNARAEILGSLWGHITAKSFIVQLGSSDYANHILDAEINYTKRSPYLPGSLLWANSKQISIAKWMP